MDKRELEYFVRVAELKSFTKASKDMNVAQSAISIKIHKLENELGILLLNRKKRQVSLTKDGQVLFSKARKILAMFEEAELEIKELYGMDKGHVRLGLSDVLGSYYFPDILTKFIKKYPGIKVSVFEGGTNEINERVINEEVDIAFIIIDEKLDKRLKVQTVLSDELYACFSPKHALAKKKSVKHDEFAHETLFLYSEGYYVRDRLLKELKAFNLKKNIKVETNLSYLIHSLVRKNIGASVFAGFLLKHIPDLVSLPFKPAIKFKWGVAWKESYHLSKASQVLLEFLIEEIEEIVSAK
ncbi:MAG: hypothetical protein COA74_03535 [Gammaproteobacteria bacterium]|nr:MAG: hypothetical protein COA74_03535 [Gammaproteobacteria bacterium]